MSKNINSKCPRHYFLFKNDEHDPKGPCEMDCKLCSFSDTLICSCEHELQEGVEIKEFKFISAKDQEVKILDEINDLPTVLNKLIADYGTHCRKECCIQMNDIFNYDRYFGILNDGPETYDNREFDRNTHKLIPTDYSDLDGMLNGRTFEFLPDPNKDEAPIYRENFSNYLEVEELDSRFTENLLDDIKNQEHALEDKGLAQCFQTYDFDLPENYYHCICHNQYVAYEQCAYTDFYDKNKTHLDKFGREIVPSRIIKENMESIGHYDSKGNFSSLNDCDICSKQPNCDCLFFCFPQKEDHFMYSPRTGLNIMGDDSTIFSNTGWDLISSPYLASENNMNYNYAANTSAAGYNFADVMFLASTKEFSTFVSHRDNLVNHSGKPDLTLHDPTTCSNLSCKKCSISNFVKVNKTEECYYLSYDLDDWNELYMIFSEHKKYYDKASNIHQLKYYALKNIQDCKCDDCILFLNEPLHKTSYDKKYQEVFGLKGGKPGGEPIQPIINTGYVEVKEEESPVFSYDSDDSDILNEEELKKTILAQKRAENPSKTHEIIQNLLGGSVSDITPSWILNIIGKDWVKTQKYNPGYTYNAQLNVYYFSYWTWVRVKSRKNKNWVLTGVSTLILAMFNPLSLFTALFGLVSYYSLWWGGVFVVFTKVLSSLSGVGNIINYTANIVSIFDFCRNHIGNVWNNYLSPLFSFFIPEKIKNWWRERSLFEKAAILGFVTLGLGLVWIKIKEYKKKKEFKDQLFDNKMSNRAQAIMYLGVSFLSVAMCFMEKSNKPMQLLQDFKSYLQISRWSWAIFGSDDTPCSNAGCKKYKEGYGGHCVECSSKAAEKIASSFGIQDFSVDAILKEPFKYSYELKSYVFKKDDIPDWFKNVPEKVQIVLSNTLKLTLEDCKKRNFKVVYEPKETQDENGRKKQIYFYQIVRSKNVRLNYERYHTKCINELSTSDQVGADGVASSSDEEFKNHSADTNKISTEFIEDLKEKAEDSRKSTEILLDMIPNLSNMSCHVKCIVALCMGLALIALGYFMWSKDDLIVDESNTTSYELNECPFIVQGKRCQTVNCTLKPCCDFKKQSKQEPIQDEGRTLASHRQDSHSRKRMELRGQTSNTKEKDEREDKQSGHTAEEHQSMYHTRNADSFRQFKKNRLKYILYDTSDMEKFLKEFPTGVQMAYKDKANPRQDKYFFVKNMTDFKQWLVKLGLDQEDVYPVDMIDSNGKVNEKWRKILSNKEAWVVEANHSFFPTLRKIKGSYPMNSHEFKNIFEALDDSNGAKPEIYEGKLKPVSQMLSNYDRFDPDTIKSLYDAYKYAIEHKEDERLIEDLTNLFLTKNSIGEEYIMTKAEVGSGLYVHEDYFKPVQHILENYKRINISAPLESKLKEAKQNYNKFTNETQTFTIETTRYFISEFDQSYQLNTLIHKDDTVCSFICCGGGDLTGCWKYITSDFFYQLTDKNAWFFKYSYLCPECIQKHSESGLLKAENHELLNFCYELNDNKKTPTQSEFSLKRLQYLLTLLSKTGVTITSDTGNTQSQAFLNLLNSHNKHSNFINMKDKVEEINKERSQSWDCKINSFKNESVVEKVLGGEFKPAPRTEEHKKFQQQNRDSLPKIPPKKRTNVPKGKLAEVLANFGHDPIINGEELLVDPNIHIRRGNLKGGTQKWEDHVNLTGQPLIEVNTRGVGYIARKEDPTQRLAVATFYPDGDRGGRVFTKKHTFFDNNMKIKNSPGECCFILNNHQYHFATLCLDYDTEYDFAKVTLDESSGVAIFKYVSKIKPYKFSVRSPKLGEEFYGVIPGPNGTFTCSGKVLEIQLNLPGYTEACFFKHNIPSIPGYSGFPCFAKSDGCLIGMHKGGYETTKENYATAMDSHFNIKIRTNESCSAVNSKNLAGRQA